MPRAQRTTGPRLWSKARIITAARPPSGNTQRPSETTVTDGPVLDARPGHIGKDHCPSTWWKDRGGARSCLDRYGGDWF